MLKNCYLVYGNDIQQIQQDIDEIKELARKKGYTNKEVCEVNAQFDWEQLLQKCQSFDLFAGKRLIELRLQSSINKDASHAIEKILTSLQEDTVLVVRTEKLTPTLQKTGWVNYIRTNGKIIKTKSSTKINPSIYDLANSAVCGHVKETLNILQNLLSTKVEPVLILWAITKEIRILIELSQAVKLQKNLHTEAQRLGVWSSNVSKMQQALNRLSERELIAMLKFSARIDEMIKGITVGNPEEALQILVLELAGKRLLKQEELII